MSKKIISQSGFTLIELLVVMSVTALLFALSTPLFNSVLFTEDLAATTDKVLSGIRSAQSRTINGKETQIWGVYFNTASNPDSYVIYRGAVYNDSDPLNEVYPLSARLSFSNISLNGGGTALLFDEFTGNTANFGTVTISNTTGNSYTISISALGFTDVQQN